MSKFYTGFQNCEIYANRKFEWLGSDSEENYLLNLQTKKRLLEMNKWVDRKFNYSLNSNGFRCDEFADKPSVMFLGCSHTFGIGLPIENVWTNYVTESLSLNSINLSVPGGSNDTAFRLAYHYIPKLKPVAVVMLSPVDTRCELILNDKESLFFFNSGLMRIKENKLEEFYNAWMSSDTNFEVNRQKNILGVSKICQDHNIKFVCFNSEQFKKYDLARDLLHFGISSHKVFSQRVLKEF